MFGSISSAFFRTLGCVLVAAGAFGGALDMAVADDGVGQPLFCKGNSCSAGCTIRTCTVQSGWYFCGAPGTGCDADPVWLGCNCFCGCGPSRPCGCN